jgi:hypothetical protein
MLSRQNQDTQNNDTQHQRLSPLQYYVIMLSITIYGYAKCHYAELSLFIVMLSVVGPLRHIN